MSQVTGDSRLLPMVVRVRMNPPPPEQWTLVSEYNVEKKDTYQVSSVLYYQCYNINNRNGNMELIDSYKVLDNNWYVIVNCIFIIYYLLFKMTCSEIIDIMNEEIEEEKKLLLELTTPKETTPTINSNDSNSSD